MVSPFLNENMYFLTLLVLSLGAGLYAKIGDGGLTRFRGIEIISLSVVLLWPGRTYAQAAESALRLPSIFSDHMALQSEVETAFWGSAPPGDNVVVEFFDFAGTSKAKAQATASVDQRWSAKLPALPGGLKGTLAITSSQGGRKEIQDVIVGEVWFAAGQSNMKFAVGTNVESEKILASANQPEIRLFRIDQQVASAPGDDVRGVWQVADTAAVREFSAVAWFFGSSLYAELKTPVGLVQATWGGTTIATWLPPASAQKFPELVELDTTYQKAATSYTEFKARQEAWQAANPTPESQKTNAATKPRGVRPPRIENTPSQCFNAMVHGLLPYTLRGILWYQGESDAARAPLYRKLFPALISGWRDGFKNPDLPFLYVELPGYNPTPNTIPDGWAWIRESQSAALTLPKVAVATGIDLGSKANVLHPKNKKAIGERLARLALGDVYGRPGLAKSPQFAGSSVENGRVRVRLESATGLRPRGPQLAGFLIRGADGQWKPAEAKVEGEKLLVWSGEVPMPVAVRYGWSGSPESTVENASGLPLRPFRTDTDPMPTVQTAAAKATDE